MLGAAAALILSVDYNRREAIARFEYPILVMFSVLGMIVMISAADLMTLYVGFELQSLALYICAAMARDSLRSTEAGLKYFVLGALASGLLIYGISLVYGFAGTTNFAALAGILAHGAGYGTVIGIVFVLVGLAFKISAAPFHMWTPDVYEGSPSPVTALFGTAPKVATMALLLAVMIGPFGHLLHQWQMLVEILSIISMALGALAAIGQTNIKRLLAYSSIGHMGYALMGLAAGTEAGIQATLVYMAIYVVMSFGSFACIIAMRRRGQAVETIADLAGLSAEAGLCPGAGDLHVGDGRHPAALRFLRQALRVLRRGECGAGHARRGRRGDQRDRRVLLSARDQGDVFRRRAAGIRPDGGRRALRHGGRRHRHLPVRVHPRPAGQRRRCRGQGVDGVIAWRLERYDELGSTSDECVARAKAAAAAGLAVQARRQVSGRGSRGRGWTAPEGNLSLSVLLRPDRPAAEAGLFALLAGIAVAEALAPRVRIAPMLKWPNDVLLDGAKLAGILIDAAPDGAKLEWLVIGIGVNLATAPEIPGRRTTSVRAHGGSLEADDAADAVLARLSVWHDAPGLKIREAWLARAHPLGTTLTVRGARGERHGTFAGLSDAGELLLRNKDRIEPVSTGDILLGRPEGNGSPCYWSLTPATPTSSSRCMTARNGAAPGVSRPRRSAPRMNTACGWRRC